MTSSSRRIEWNKKLSSISLLLYLSFWTHFFAPRPHMGNVVPMDQGCRKRGAGGPWPPHKIWTRGEKRPNFLAIFGLSTIKQYFLVTLFPHMVNLPGHSNFSMRSHTVITTNCSEKNKLWKLSANFALCHLQLSYLQCSLTISS